ncbi:MAG: Tim44 domain-containing protein [Rhodobiaceae bacterium]|nr:Tim44 domain-containing protein [Rhodobiaceae bacterium]
MNGIFDVYTLIFLVVAVVIFLRLRSVLGRRTGNERQPFDPLARSDKPQGAGANDDKVVSMPARKGAKPAPKPMAIEDDTERWKGIAEPGSPLEEQLDAMKAADPRFDASGFLNGARIAYEMIVMGFAEGDRKSLRSLLSPDVYDGFAAAITEREERGEVVESRFIGIDSATIESVDVRGDQGQITVRFKSSLISVTRDKDGEIVDGDPKAVSDVTDVWTFARTLSARDPNWQLVATESA